MVKLAPKDLGIAVDLGKSNTDLDLGASIETYKHAIKEGREEQDWTSIFLSLQKGQGYLFQIVLKINSGIKSVYKMKKTKYKSFFYDWRIGLRN